MTEQDKMNGLIDKVHQWGVDRKIIGNGKLETQWLKLLSEFGEMCDTLAKGGDPIDDIGDQIVVIIMMAGIAGKINHMKEMGIGQIIKGRFDALQVISESLPYLRVLASDFRPWAAAQCATSLQIIAQNRGLTLYQCLEHAYNQIKDRKGYLNEQGVFIKE